MVPLIGEIQEHRNVNKWYRLLWLRKSAKHDGIQEFVLKLKEWSAE